MTNSLVDRPYEKQVSARFLFDEHVLPFIEIDAFVGAAVDGSVIQKSLQVTAEFQWATTRASFRRIEYAKALFPIWQFEYFRVCHSDLRIAISGIPMRPHCSARKFKLFDQRLVVLRAISQVHQIYDLVVCLHFYGLYIISISQILR
jgi:hypothetical protein